ncbi:ABC transporter ATP-binding protein [Paraburkholderia terrae]|uniref:ABC transporter ATP-binding protein n=1 Tax=Paraburkholderia terrae TaxID=311230 RepID=UPI0030E39372
MSSDVAIRAAAVTKGFESYERPANRLKRSLFGLLGALSPLPSLRSLLLQRAQSCVRTFWALKGVDFEITRGETVGIIGRNGSGKSTLLQIICGTLAPTGGDVQTEGRIAALLELGSGFDVEYTGRENIYMNGQLHGLTREQIDERLDEIIAFADIGQFIDQPVKTYSSGMFVRLAFAVIAHVDADILVIDEALSVGDAFFTQKCMRFLRRFQKTGTVLFVSHDSAAVRSLCERVIWLDRGDLRQSGDANEVCTNYFEAFYRQQQGDGASWTSSDDLSDVKPHASPLTEPVEHDHTVDQRQRFVTTLRHATPTLSTYCIDPHSLGTRQTKTLIEAVHLVNEKGSPISWVVGGERVLLQVRFKHPGDGQTPIVAFYMKDRLGQPLFGDDTSLAQSQSPTGADTHSAFVAEFMFDMPILPPGDYAISVLLGTGTASASNVLHCLHDALIVKSESPSVATGLVGQPMTNVALYVREAVEET